LILSEPIPSPLRIVFMGTAPLAAASLEALLAVPQFQVTAVVSQPDRPKGRDLKLQPTAVKEVALAHGLPVFQPEKARDPAFIETLRPLAPDLIVVAAYGQILPRAILELPRYQCLNVHASLLPRWRGAAPIQWSILAGDTETGVTIMKVDVGLDTGDLLSMARTPIEPGDNAQTLHDRLARMGAELLVQTIPDYVAGRITPRKQPEGSTYARKLEKADGRLDWRLPAVQLWNRVRAFTPWPGAFTFLGEPPNPKLLKVWEAEVVPDTGAPGVVLHAGKEGVVVACGEQSLRLRVLQREGGRRLAAAEFLAGNPLKSGQTLQ
jgi:methionyl-tRNA formyltransferase